MARKDTDLHRILETEQAILRRLSEIEKHLNPHHIHRFTITQSGDNTMPLTPLAPGNSPVFTATPVPSTAVPATPPTWTSSDTTNAPVSVDATGLVATVAIPASAPVGTAFVLTVSYTNADGTVATGSFSGTIVAPPSPDISSFTIEQTQ
jgi:hypothetical protein